MLKSLTKEVHDLLLKSGKTISFAESCTGGFLQKLITDNSGSSDYFEGGVVSYSNRLKEKILGVSPELLLKHGAVSSECAMAMVLGLKKLTDADICISVTGIAGPSGGSKEKPVGTVWFGFGFLGELESCCQCFTGNREEVREESAVYVLERIKSFYTN